jgi:hypothetical protein
MLTIYRGGVNVSPRHPRCQKEIIMPVPVDCVCPAQTVLNVAVPGPQGAAGPAAPTPTTTADFVVPALAATVTIAVTTTAPFSVGQNLWIGGYNFQIVAGGINSLTSLTLKWIGLPGDGAANATVASGAVVNSGTGLLDFLSLNTVAALTDSTAGTASDTLTSTVGIQTLAFYVTLANIAANGLVGAFTPGYAFKVLKVDFAVEKAVTTASKLATITPKISGTSVSGGILSLTSATLTPVGTVLAGSTVSSPNTGTAGQTLAFGASAVTTFVEGTGWIIVQIQNLDTLNAVASLAAKINNLLTALKRLP